MSTAKDYFDDAELTSLAIEIIKDRGLRTNVPIDPYDSFICELAEEIEQELLCEMYAHVANPASTYTDPSIYLPSIAHPSLNTIQSTDTNTVYLSYPSMAPTIVNHLKLSANNSFNQTLPPIPSPKSKAGRYKFPGNRKSPVTAYKKRNRTSSFSPKPYTTTRFQSPYHPPPEMQLRISLAQADSNEYILSPTSSIFGCMHISPRDQTPTPKACTIPNFSDAYDVAIHSNKKKKKRSDSNKTKKERKKRMNEVKRVRSPVFVNTDRKIKKKRNKNKRSRSQKNIDFRAKIQLNNPKGRKRRRDKRANSLSLRANNEQKHNEYMVEVDHGFIFINK